MSGLVGVFAALLLGAVSAQGLVIASGDGTGNTDPPRDDPGWERMGTKSPCPPQCGLTYVYLGGGWVLTAAHVTAQNVRLLGDGREYPRVEGSAVRIGGRRSRVDLLLFRIQGAPERPLLPISETTPPTGTPILMIAAGQSRGEPLPGDPSPGWSFRLPARLRWGTNRVFRSGVTRFTHVFSMRFERPQNPLATAYEAHAVRGDSGGAVFVHQNDRWELAGILVAATQPATYGGESFAADLAYYRDELLGIIHGAATDSPNGSGAPRTAP